MGGARDENADIQQQLLNDLDNNLDDNFRR